MVFKRRIIHVFLTKKCNLFLEKTKLSLNIIFENFYYQRQAVRQRVKLTLILTLKPCFFRRIDCSLRYLLNFRAHC